MPFKILEAKSIIFRLFSPTTFVSYAISEVTWSVEGDLGAVVTCNPLRKTYAIV